MAFRSIEFEQRLVEPSLGREKVEIIPLSQRVQIAIANFVEYPAGPWRQGSSHFNWRFPDWIDYQVQKLVGKV